MLITRKQGEVLDNAFQQFCLLYSIVIPDKRSEADVLIWYPAQKSCQRQDSRALSARVKATCVAVVCNLEIAGYCTGSGSAFGFTSLVRNDGEKKINPYGINTATSKRPPNFPLTPLAIIFSACR